jgi:hypothetical protein
MINVESLFFLLNNQQTIMLIDNDPDVFFMIILVATTLFGLFVFGVFDAIAYITSPPLITNNVKL